MVKSLDETVLLKDAYAIQAFLHSQECKIFLGNMLFEFVQVKDKLFSDVPTKEMILMLLAGPEASKTHKKPHVVIEELQGGTSSKLVFKKKAINLLAKILSIIFIIVFMYVMSKGILLVFGKNVNGEKRILNPYDQKLPTNQELALYMESKANPVVKSLYNYGQSVINLVTNSQNHKSPVYKPTTKDYIVYHLHDIFSLEFLKKSYKLILINTSLSAVLQYTTSSSITSKLQSTSNYMISLYQVKVINERVEYSLSIQNLFKLSESFLKLFGYKINQYYLENLIEIGLWRVMNKVRPDNESDEILKQMLENKTTVVKKKTQKLLPTQPHHQVQTRPQITQPQEPTKTTQITQQPNSNKKSDTAKSSEKRSSKSQESKKSNSSQRQQSQKTKSSNSKKSSNSNSLDLQVIEFVPDQERR